jgi:multidrug efflux system membrane fusion protein
MLSIQRLDPIYADFTVTENDLAEVRAEMARGTLKTLVRLPSDPEGRERAGTLTFLDNAVQAGSGTVSLRATVPNADRHFWPGQFVTVRLILETQKNAVLIPSQATQISQQGPYVFVIKPDDTAELRQVTLGLRQGDDVVVTHGVAAGERVVLAGQLTLVPGAKVRIQQATPGAPPLGQQPAPDSKPAGGKS